MKWNQVSVLTTSEAVEAVSNILMEAGANGVAIEDSLDALNFESDAFGEILDIETFDHIKEGAKVIAYFPEIVFLPEILPTVELRVNQLEDFGLEVGEKTIETSVSLFRISSAVSNPSISGIDTSKNITSNFRF